MNMRDHWSVHVEYARIVAILALLAYHLGALIPGDNRFGAMFTKLSARGWMATDFFLVLAGYFFVNIYTRDNTHRFYYTMRNRAIRILPGYAAFMLIYLLFGVDLQNNLGHDMIPSDFFWVYALTFSMNLSFAYGSLSGIALEGLFALCIVVQLYILFALVFYLFKTTGSRITVLLALQLIALVLRLSPAFYGQVWKTYFFTLTRMDGFLWGCALFLIRDIPMFKQVLVRYSNKLWLASLIAFLTLSPLMGYWRIHSPGTTVGVFTLVSVLFFFTLNALLNMNSRKERGFYAGSFVYSIYLIKLPLIYVVAAIAAKYFGYLSDTETSILIIAISVLACVAWGAVGSVLSTELRHRSSEQGSSN